MQSGYSSTAPWQNSDVAKKLPSFVDLQRAVCDAVNDVRQKDPEILGTTERVLVGRLMIYLNSRLKPVIDDELRLDQEYERAGQVTKRLAGHGGIADRKIVPDMILHRRFDQGPDGNLLAIEVKTLAGQHARLHDSAKLAVLTGHAQSALAYEKSLRLVGDPAPRQALRGNVYLPPGMHPYKYGLWLLVTPGGTEFRWWIDGAAPRQIPCA
jgi:hypothetical protein